MPNYDSRLEPKRRRRTHEEIEDILTDEYSKYIEELSVSENIGALFKKLDAEHKKAALEAVMCEVFEQYGCGITDSEFIETIDLREIEWKEI